MRGRVVLVEDFADRASRPALVGGHPALDLVNTVSWRLDPSRQHDNLTDPFAAIAWSQRAGLLSESVSVALSTAVATDARGGGLVLHDVLVLRDQLAGALEDLLAEPDRCNGGRACSDVRGASVVAPAGVHAAIVDAVTHSELAGPPPMRWRLTVDQPRDLVRLLALHALDLLQSPHLHLLRRCAGPGCGWMFLDRTRNYTRRYCNTAECGNRDRARRHYAARRRHHTPDFANRAGA